MKIFIDTANIDQIREVNSWGILDGVTTNPTLVSRENKDFKTLVKEICEIVDGPISAEAMSLDADGIIKEGRELSKIHPNINIKVPMTEAGIKATKVLSSEGIDVNVTLIFSPAQALLACKAGARFVSPFVGRLDDIGHYGMDVVEETLDMLWNYDFETEIIVASVRHPTHVLEAARMGAHIATIPYAVLKKMFKHPLTDIGIERFLKDWEKVEKR
ncbi:MAG: fructose-6-phosphate aldolase [Methanomassiliicoccales archaeon]|nr:fructose-6-phosphate aldolase [Methanomassiliicoccales archaeon]NYT14803.1 fructose-6-phosphate aldolase [Methanomassiliicoccales archaeon]